MNNLKAQLKTIFHSVFQSNEFDQAVIERYFHPDYTQDVNGEALNYSQFIDHIRTLKKTLSNIHIDFRHLVEEGDQVTSVHFASGTKSNGKNIKAKVIAYFRFKDNKIIYCNELTQLIEGETSDKDLGSRH